MANLHTNRINQGLDPVAALAELPLDALAYVHVAGGYQRAGLWHDSHTRAPTAEIYDLLTTLCRHTRPPGVLLEWDGDYPSDRVLADTLARIRAVTESAPALTRHPATAPISAPAGSGPDLAAARDQFAQQQARLVAALVAGAPHPAGFDSHRLLIEADRLAVRTRRH